MKICSHCATRLNAERTVTDTGECDLCGGLLSQVDIFFDIFKEETKEIEFSNFIVGVDADERYLKNDDDYRKEHCTDCKSFKKEFSTILGRKIEELLGKEAEFGNPELVFTVKQESGDYKLWTKSCYIQGRYRKLRRGIPQSPWINPSREREMERSISEYIGLIGLKYLKGRDYTFFASGREDVDTLMLGEGRPFYVEILQPKLRKIDLDLLAEQVKKFSNGGVEILALKLAAKEDIEELKGKVFDKSYEVGVKIEGSIENIESKIKEFEGITIHQRTPTRVLGLRKDRMRDRKIHSISIKESEGGRIRLIITAEAGTYIKEFVTGDNDRTNPSLSQRLGVNVQIEYLNVLEVN